MHFNRISNPASSVIFQPKPTQPETESSRKSNGSLPAVLALTNSEKETEIQVENKKLKAKLSKKDNLIKKKSLRKYQKKRRLVKKNIAAISDTNKKDTVQNSNNSDSTPAVKSSPTEMKMAKRKRSVEDIPASWEYVALDCEFVGVGDDKHSALGRCSIVDFNGRVLCDLYSKPEEPVTDYRTRWSGIRSHDLINAVPFENTRNIVKSVLKDHIVVGHSVHNDFYILDIKVPDERVRDTSQYKPLRHMAGLSGSQQPGLKKLARNLLGRRIQKGEHSSVEDAKATMDVFKLVRIDWENELLREKEDASRRRKRVRRDSEEQDSVSSNSTATVDSDDDDFSYLADSFWPDDIDR